MHTSWYCLSLYNSSQILENVTHRREECSFICPLVSHLSLWVLSAVLLPPPSASQDSCYCFLPFFLLYALPSCPWVRVALWQAWHIPLDCDALWQKINTPPLVWYGDKTVIIPMLCLLWTLVLPHNCSRRCPSLISLLSEQFVIAQEGNCSSCVQTEGVVVSGQ